MRKLLTIVLTFLGGAFFVAEFLIPAQIESGGRVVFENPLTPYGGLAMDLVVVIGTMAFLLGPINLARSHIGNFIRMRTGWFSSLVFLVFLFGSIIIAGGKDFVLMPWMTERLGTASAQDWSEGLTRAYNVLFYGLNFGFGTTSMALLTFYLVSAAYRSFRLTGLDSAVMFAAATVVLLGRAPIGDWLTSGLEGSLAFLKLSSIEAWLMTTPNAAVQRAVQIGTFAGAFAAALRFWLSLGQRSAE